jgi:drug/metabolite transporter (DMT)-like permease
VEGRIGQHPVILMTAATVSSIVENLGAVAAAGVTYIPPVVALVIGVFLAGDMIHPLGYLATVFILSGVALLQYGGRRELVSKA